MISILTLSTQLTYTRFIHASVLKVSLYCSVMDSIYAKSRELLASGSFNTKDVVDFVDYAELFKVKYIIEKYIPTEDLSGMINAIKSYCVGDGCGLRIGGYVDDLVTELFRQSTHKFESYHSNDADCKIGGVPLSLKTCTNPAGTTFALSWSKNKTTDMSNNFSSHIMVIVSKSGQWWKSEDEIKAGIYLISKNWCKYNITLSSNNKSNKIISRREVYKMLRNAVHFIPLQESKHAYKFNILKAFHRESETEHTALS